MVRSTSTAVSRGMHRPRRMRPDSGSYTIAPLNSTMGAFTPMALAMGMVASAMRPLASTTFTPASMAR